MAPQTLQIATMLLYLNGFFALIGFMDKSDWVGIARVSKGSLGTLVGLGVVEAFKQAQILKSANFNFTPLMTTALIFLVITIPMTRLVDRLAAKDRAAQQGGAR